MPASFPYIFACLSLSLLFRQSLLYDSQFNISIRTRLISTSSKYVVGVKATARLFIASVSKQKPRAHFIAMAEMVVRSA
jgi:hypothetical protein